MRDLIIRPETKLGLMLAGMRLRLHKSPENLADLLGVTAQQVIDWESGGADTMPLPEFATIMSKMGVRIAVQAAPLSGIGQGPLSDPVEDEPGDPEPPAAVSDAEVLPPKVVYVQNSAALASALRRNRLHRGLTQQQVCDATGLNPSTYSRHEKYGGNVTIDYLAEYARFFGIHFVVGEPPRADS